MRSEPTARRRPAQGGRISVATPFGEAQLVPEPGRPWRVLLRLDGEDCSHVDLQDPGHLEFAYVRRLGDVADLVAPPHRPIVALHLGGGGFTLPRYVAHTRPGSRQTVAEIDPVLVELAREHLGLITGRDLKVRVVDAGVLLERRSAASGDLVVLDCFRGVDVPEHLIAPAAIAHAHRVLRPGGLFAVNVIDVPPLPVARRVARELADAFDHLAVVTARKVLRGRQGGNVVLVAAHRGLPTRELATRALRGAAPELVLTGAEAHAFAT
jgi:spermidine synthase